MAVLKAQEELGRLGKFILENVPGEPSKNEGVVDCAIRLILAGIGEKQNRLLAEEDRRQHKVLVEEDEQLVHKSVGELEDKALRGTGRTRDQMKFAPRGAYFIFCNKHHVGYARDLAKSVGRHDLIIMPLNILSNAEFMRMQGLGPNNNVVLDHAAPENMNEEMWNNLRSGKFTYVPYAPPTPIPALAGNPEEAFAEWSAEPTPWNGVNGNSIELRTLEGRKVARLKILAAHTDDAQVNRAHAEEVAKQACRLLDHRSNYRTAAIAPRHVEQGSAQPILKRMEAAAPNLESLWVGAPKKA